MFRYLHIYSSNIFNGDTPVFELDSLNGSDVTRAVIFAGKPSHPFGAVLGAVCYLYLELSTELKPENIYYNLHIYENLLCLVSGKPGGPGQGVDISGKRSFSEVLKEYEAEEKDYNKPNIQHHGMVREYNIIAKLPACICFLNAMRPEHREKAERALATFIIAEEIGMTVNPHTKATVRATLYLSAINQLAENPEECSHKINYCSDCRKENIAHQKAGHAKKIEDLMRELLTGTNLDRGIKLIKTGYYIVRSPFLHDGMLAGGEYKGGWIADDPLNIQFLEDLTNYMGTCRHLIELYMQKHASEAVGQS